LDSFYNNFNEVSYPHYIIPRLANFSGFNWVDALTYLYQGDSAKVKDSKNSGYFNYFFGIRGKFKGITFFSYYREGENSLDYIITFFDGKRVGNEYIIAREEADKSQVESIIYKELKIHQDSVYYGAKENFGLDTLKCDLYKKKLNLNPNYGLKLVKVDTFLNLFFLSIEENKYRLIPLGKNNHAIQK
jgi:hypothetical protein